MGIFREDENSLTEPHNVTILKNMGKSQGYANVPRNERGDVILETGYERRKRHISLWIIYTTVFVQCMGASMVITGMWPYLLQLDKDATKEWLGLIVGANPLGQLIFSPVIGWWCIRANSIRIPSVFCLVLFIAANVWFPLLTLADENAKYYMLISRFLVGVSSGSMVACRTFIAQGTLVKERTGAVSFLSLAQSLGFILGPVVQVSLTPLGKTGFDIVQGVPFNMYTSVGWIAALVGIFNLILYLPQLFLESDIAARELLAKEKVEKSERGGDAADKDINWSKYPPDYWGLSSIFYTFFVVFFCYSVVEALATPVTIDQFGWTNEEAVKKVGMLTAISSVLSLLVFLTVPQLSKRFDERKLLLLLGMIPFAVGRMFFFPYPGFDMAPMQESGCVMNGTVNPDILTEQECELLSGSKWDIVKVGCPPEQSWCQTIPALNVYFCIAAWLIGTIGFPFTVVQPQTLCSAMLGARPQGNWMGALTAVTSLARVVGPLIATYLYTEYGTIAINGLTLITILTAWASQGLVYNRLVPFKLPNGR